MGASGLAAARYLYHAGLPLTVMDSRTAPPELARIQKQLPQARMFLGRLDASELNTAVQLVVSPGVSLDTDKIAEALAKGVPVLGEVELFARVMRAQVIAITGTNGKSTVTAMLGQMIERAGITVAVGGNLGPPALELLEYQPTPTMYILELSSFQLETLESLRPIAAGILNIAPDHLDRYRSFEDYRMAKMRIIKGASCVVINVDDPWLHPLAKERKCIGFTGGIPTSTQFGLREINNSIWLCHGERPLIREAEIRLPGRHNTLNVLAALALGHAASIPMVPMCEIAREFVGLAHRCELVAMRNGVRWFNDSKGTNVGATVAAVEGLAHLGPITLIAGGVIKEPELSPLLHATRGRVEKAVLLGRDASLLEALFTEKLEVRRVGSLREAVTCAREITSPGSSVLLSPAAASFDMFKDYKERGELFARYVQELGCASANS